jgi:hypothetical protein
VNFEVFRHEVSGTSCEGCGLPIHGTGYRVRGIRGASCSLACVETVLFETGCCRWCGNAIAKAYTSIESRLCSPACEQNYRKHVLGDKSAALGTGERFLLWLQSHQAGEYAKLIDAQYAENPGKLGRPTKNGHTMSGAERMRESRKRKTQLGAISGPTFVTSGGQAMVVA